MSFNSTMSATHPSPYIIYNDQMYVIPGLDIQYDWFHPPLAHPQIPMLDLDEWTLPPSAYDSQLVQTPSSHFHAEPPSASMRTQDLPALRTGPFEYNDYVATQSTISAPQCAYNSGSGAQYFDNQQASMTALHDGSNSERGTQHDMMRRNPSWEYQQQQQRISRPSSTHVDPSAGFYSNFHVPTTTAAWG
jgi:hypothetical protein